MSSLFNVHSIGLFLTVSEINPDFSRKSQKKNSYPVYFTPSSDGVLLKLGYRRMELSKYSDGAIGPRKKFDDILNHVQCCEVIEIQVIEIHI